MSIRRFLVFSLAVHLLALLIIFLVPTTGPEPPEPGQYVVRIINVMPEEPPRPAPPGEPSGKRPVAARDVPEKATMPLVSPPALRPAPEQHAAIEDRDIRLQPPPWPGKPGIPSPMEMLLDREAIRNAVVSERKDEEGGGGITFSTDDYKYAGYMMMLKKQIEDIWVYPREAARKGIYGDLYITFVIKKDGTLGSVKLDRTSGHEMLDEAALQALREAAPFWPLPEWWEEEALTVPGHFIYTIYGSYLR